MCFGVSIDVTALHAVAPPTPAALKPWSMPLTTPTLIATMGDVRERYACQRFDRSIGAARP